MNTMTRLSMAVMVCLASQAAWSGVLDPECTAEKGAKSAATKATVGVGGRCSPAEAAKDTAKDKVDVKDKVDAKDKDNTMLNRDDDKDAKKNAVQKVPGAR